MMISYIHMNTNWYVTPREAVRIQKQLRSQISIQAYTGVPRLIAGVDVSFTRFEREIYAGIVLLSFPEMQVLSYVTVISESTFPYIPGLLSFREIPALLQAWKLLPHKPDLIVVDGHGIAHPRRLGIATHLGLELDVPTIGCAKKPLVGHFNEPGPALGSSTPVFDHGEEIGLSLRSKLNVKPIFISPGHRTDIPSSKELILACIRRHKLPEPTRQAHLVVNRLRRREIEAGLIS